MTDYQLLIKKQRDFFATGKTRNLAFRIEQLEKLRQVVIEKHRDIEASLMQDLNKCEFEAFATEVTAMIDTINDAVVNLPRGLNPSQ